jgi:hypothetical protein
MPILSASLVENRRAMSNGCCAGCDHRRELAAAEMIAPYHDPAPRDLSARHARPHPRARLPKSSRLLLLGVV